ncbi:MAG: GNAT family N-acetyltransferase [Thermoleophilaceae bacterium]
MALEVRPVRSRRDLMRFIKLPFRLYKGQPNWVPPLIYERKRHLNRDKNPFFDHAEAEYFLAWRDGRPVGRISAHIDRRLNDVQDNDWGLFGFFECEDDQDAADALLNAAEDWNRERGRDRIVGPFDFSTNHECGLLVEGYELKPQVLEFWHHPYYQGLLEQHGLAKAMDLYKWHLDVSDREKILPVIFELSEKVESEHGVVVRNMRKKDFQDEVRRFMEVYNSAWEKNWGFVPLTEDELEDYAKQLKPLLDERWAWIAEKDGQTVGAALTLLDWNEVLIDMNGRLFPIGWFKFLTGRKKIRHVRVFALGVKPEYQHTGVAARFYVEHFDQAARGLVKSGEMGWILEVNRAMNRGMEAMGGQIVKRYRLYEKLLRDAQ